MYQLLQLSGPSLEPGSIESVDRVLDEGGLEDRERLEFVRDQLQAHSLEFGRTMTQRRFAIRPAKEE